MNGTIYCLENTLTDKMYIGQTVDFERRMQSYASGNGHGYLNRAITKYGWEHFSVKVVEEIPVEDLNEAERFWIAFLDTMSPKGYNLREGGSGGKIAEATKQLMREAALRRIDEATVPSNFISSNPGPEATRRRLEEGTHHFQSDGYYEKLSETLKSQIAERTHHFASNHPLKDPAKVAQMLRTRRKNRGILDWVDMLEEDTLQ